MGLVHPEAAVCLPDSASIHNQQDQLDEAQLVCERSLAMFVGMQRQNCTVFLQGDIAHLERELARKEAAFGPVHPEVADCLSNLAIVHNQEGHLDKAQPLYERALAIFEKTEGPNSQEVAHTLTDLAVLHFEEKRDAVGRPLLERALEIQRANLGENHPDVIAILDVLNGE